MNIAIISGDIINSGKLPGKERQLLYEKLEKFIKKEEQKGEGFRGEINQGDWFQCLIKDPTQALRYALILKSYLRSFTETELPMGRVMKSRKGLSGLTIDARIGIGIGKTDFLATRLGASDGPAFRLSGRLLEKIKKTNTTLAGEVEKKEALTKELETILLLLDFILSKTTALQCQVIYYKLLGKKETEIAKELHILQSAVNQRSTAAGWNAIEAAVLRFETIITPLK